MYRIFLHANANSTALDRTRPTDQPAESCMLLPTAVRIKIYDQLPQQKK